MSKWFSFIDDYRNIEKPIFNVIISEFFIQMVNATFMLVLPLYMSRMNYTNEQIALFLTFRFIGVFLLALPIGKFIKGKKLYPFFYISAIGVPLFGLASVAAIHFKIDALIYITLFLWGSMFTFMQIPVSPFILRNSTKANHTPAIALSYSTWSFGGIVSGVITAILCYLNKDLFNEQNILIIFSGLGFIGLFFLIKNPMKELVEERSITHDHHHKHNIDWHLIIKALIPTLIIATGAGLTIPFISLFFENVHHISTGEFSTYSAVASLLVAYAALMVPKIKKYVGYKIAIPTTQSLAVISLIALATTELYSQYSIALYIAIACYLLRQPLMNMAGPMTTELVLNYVGKNNREITSALTSAIWSGSWVLSGLMVNILFRFGFQFVNIFLITSALYALGVMMYYVLIVDYVKREQKGLIEN
ncbi:MAG: MFS transporter [Bacteroidota bacterium]|nr:MFS transporter [Bacteroidota bacterium]